jgi:hypothetical protein
MSDSVSRMSLVMRFGKSRKRRFVLYEAQGRRDQSRLTHALDRSSGSSIVPSAGE